MRQLARLSVVLLVVGTVLGLSKIHARYVADPAYDYTGSARFAWSIAFMLLLLTATYAVGLPSEPRTARAALGASASASFLSALGISIVQLLTGDALLPRFVVFGSVVLLVPLQLLPWALARHAVGRALDRDVVLVVAEPDEIPRLLDDVKLSPEQPLRLLPIVSPHEVEVGEGRQPLLELAERQTPTVVVLSRTAQAKESVVEQAGMLHAQGTRIRTLSMFYEQWLGKLPVGELERVSLLFDIGELHEGGYPRFKRLLDVAVALLLMPIFGLTAGALLLGNLVANRGPLLYRQTRVGKQGRVFTILKFRTMRQSVDPTTWTSERDPRVTPLGRVLRVTHLDELPQVVNILRGDLSIVGPRPEQPQYVEELTTKLPFYELRHLVRPGLTGWAQVKYGYASSDDHALEKLQYEFYYLRHQGLSLDLRIIGRTLRTVVRKQGR